MDHWCLNCAEAMPASQAASAYCKACIIKFKEEEEDISPSSIRRASRTDSSSETSTDLTTSDTESTSLTTQSEDSEIEACSPTLQQWPLYRSASKGLKAKPKTSKSSLVMPMPSAPALETQPLPEVPRPQLSSTVSAFASTSRHPYRPVLSQESHSYNESLGSKIKKHKARKTAMSVSLTTNKRSRQIAKGFFLGNSADEQDGSDADEDLDALSAQNNKNSAVHGESTPTGKHARSLVWSAAELTLKDTQADDEHLGSASSSESSSPTPELEPERGRSRFSRRITLSSDSSGSRDRAVL